MTPDQIRLKQNPILTNMLLGVSQSALIGEHLLPRLPQALSSIMLARMGKEALRRYDLARSPGANTKRINIKYEGEVYTVKQKSVEVPITREAIREADESSKLNVGAHLDVSQLAMTTASDVLGLDYEIDVAELATNAATYLPTQVTTLTGTSKWKDPASTPIQDIANASDVIRGQIGKKPNTLILSALAFSAIQQNPEIIKRLPTNILGMVNLEHLKLLFGVSNIFVGEAIWVDEKDQSKDVWGNNAILAYAPTIGAPSTGRSMSMAEPAFGLTNVMEGHPFAEAPYYEPQTKSWIYGATFERMPNIVDASAGFLFKEPA